MAGGDRLRRIGFAVVFSIFSSLCYMLLKAAYIIDGGHIGIVAGVGAAIGLLACKKKKKET
jgi:hypothetical protein